MNKIQFSDQGTYRMVIILTGIMKEYMHFLITLKEGFTCKLHLSLNILVGKTGQILFSQHTER